MANNLGKPIDMFNHSIDGIRYGATAHLSINNRGEYNLSFL